MKKLFYIVTFLAFVSIQASYAQDSIKTQPSQLLTSYYNIKDALVKDNAVAAASNAQEFIQTINGINKENLPEASRNTLLKDAGQISETKDIKRQRENFANLSANMFTLAKDVKLTTEPMYQQYCPMKKSSWLSPNKAIKNPYYGKSMLTCGKVAATL